MMTFNVIKFELLFLMIGFTVISIYGETESNQELDPVCGPNETYKSCGYICPDTCENGVKVIHPVCTKDCGAGCFCNPGFIRDVKSNECILETLCSISDLSHKNSSPWITSSSLLTTTTILFLFSLTSILISINQSV